MKNIIKRLFKIKKKQKEIIIKKNTEKCFSCKWCAIGDDKIYFCAHYNRNQKGRGMYCFENCYDDCDCGGFENKKEIKKEI